VFNHILLRSGVGLPLAAIIVWGLFGFMTAMISDEFVPSEVEAQRELTAFVFPGETSFPEPLSKREFTPLDPATPPPPLPALSAGSSIVSLPTVSIGGSVPALNPDDFLQGISVTPVVYGNRVAQPLSPPAVSYPPRLAKAEVEGRCDVRFDVDVSGKPHNVEADCTHKGFKREAERAVRRVLFAPEIIDGRPRARQNVIYPREFRLKTD